MGAALGQLERSAQRPHLHFVFDPRPVAQGASVPRLVPLVEGQTRNEDEVAGHSAPTVPEPPPSPRSIFDIILEEKDVNVPKQAIAEHIRGLIRDSGLE